MVTIPDCEGIFEPLLRILEDKMAAGDDHVDAYLRMIDRLREEEDVFVNEVLNFLARLVVVFKRDIKSDKSDLCQASLQALGHCFYQQQIAGSICLPDGQDLVQALLTRIQETKDKGICTRALWCLAKQNLDSVVINTKLESILSSLEAVITKDLQSVTVDHEALSVIERFLQQIPKPDLIKTVDCWSKLVFPLLVSSASKVRERALAVLSAGLEVMMSSREKVVKILVPLLKGCLLKDFAKMFTEKKELFVLKCWCCIVPILGETLHRGGSLINDLLKLVEQGFRDQSTEVQVMSFSAWNILVDNFALSSDVLCSPRRVKLIMTPLRNLAVKERNEAVETARLSTWWHFVCLLGPRVQERFDQVCTPLLQFIFGTAIDQVSLLRTKDGLSDLKCPPTPTNNKLLADMMVETPKSSIRRSLKDAGTPRTPTVLNASFAKPAKQKLLAQGCEILMELLVIDDAEIGGNSGLIITLAERLQTVTFKKPEDFKKHACLMTNAIREGFKALGTDLAEPLGIKIWTLLVTRISKLLEKGSSSDYSETLLPLLAVMQDFVDSNLLTPSLTLKMLSELSDLSSKVLSHHMASLHSKDNPQGSPALLLIQLLFTSHLLENIWPNERLHLTFEHLINGGMTSASGQLFFLKTVLNLLEKASSSVIKKDTLWRLWSCVVDQLSEHIQKTNDVNQGDALEHDFSTLYLALMFPLKHVLDARLSQGVGKEVSKTVAELYRSFSRAAALVPTAETNICCEELCNKILSVDGDWNSKDLAFIDTLVNLSGVIIECLDFSIPGLFAMATTAAGKSPNTTPTKWNKRLQKPMGNFTSLVHLIAKLLTACERPSGCKDPPQTLGILTAILTNLIDKLSYLFLHVSGAVTITSILRTLAPVLVHFIENAHASTKITKTTLDRQLFTARLTQKIEKLWADLLTCVQTRLCGPYDSDLLLVLSPLLEVTLGHPKRSIKNHAVMFWNATFAHTQVLNYPEKLRPVLQIAKEKMSLTLPEWENIEISVKETQVDLESEDLTQQTDIMKPLPYGILASPQRRKTTALSGGSPQLKGSFLHRAVSADKHVENSSPKMFGRSPKLGRPRNSPASTHVRRKLPLSKYDEDNDQDYVMIAPSPKKKRLLTEHQKEIMRSRREVPTLYNELDQSQDCTQFSQFTFPSQAQVTSDSTPSSTPEEAKNLSLEHSKSSAEILAEKKDELVIDVVSEKIVDENEPKGDTVKGDFAAVSQDVEMEVGCEGHSVGLAEDEDDSPSGVAGKSDSGGVEDVMNTEKEPETGDDECEVTSPDFIPSSQTPSCDSPFQSLRRVTIPLSSILPNSLDSMKSVLNAGKNKLEKPQPETERGEEGGMETGGESDEENSTEKCKSSVKVGETASTVSKTTVSPVAGRTRRRLQQKTAAENSSSQTEPEIEPTEKEVSELTQSSSELDKTDSRVSSEKPAEPKLAGVPRDTTSSPVPSMMNKFLRPFAAGGSPCRVTLLGRNSPGVSPTTGILKRWPGNKQSLDSPSPPGKVRRVSFALPAKDESSEDSHEKESETSITASAQVKMSSSSSFTAVKQRRSVPANTDQSTRDSTDCVFPDLVSCTVPVEQILPSILAMSWSRGMGHLVRAQNIHTVGNLSALKEDQVKNLPIKSPKVPTLKKALKRFHQSQRGKSNKLIFTKQLADASLKEDKENREDVISTEHAQLENEAAVESEPRKAPDLVGDKIDAKVIESEEMDSNEQSNESRMASFVDTGKVSTSDEVTSTEASMDTEVGHENIAAYANCDQVEGNAAGKVAEGSDKESLTPPLAALDTDAIEVTADSCTPPRETCALPTKLFTHDNPDTGCAEMLSLVECEEDDEVIEVSKECDGETKINEVAGLTLPIQSVPEEATVLAEAEDDNMSHKETFCGCLRSLKELASPDVLRDLSSEEIFEAHHNLTEVMSVVVQALRSRCQSPRSKK